MKRRRLFTGLLILLAVVLGYIFLDMLTQYRNEIRDSIAEEYRTLNNYDSAIKDARDIERELVEYRQQINSLESHILTSGTASMAAAELQGIAEDSASKAGINILSVRPMNTMDYRDYTEVPIQVDGTGNIKQFRDFLKSLEDSRIYLRVGRLTVTVTNTVSPKELNLKLVVSGIIKRRHGEKTAPTGGRVESPLTQNETEEIIR